MANEGSGFRVQGSAARSPALRAAEAREGSGFRVQGSGGRSRPCVSLRVLLAASVLIGGGGWIARWAAAQECAERVCVDFDCDQDVDLTDFSWFQHCFNGQNHILPIDCYTLIPCDLESDPVFAPFADGDSDGDLDVDLTDFEAFLACYNGPNVPPACEAGSLGATPETPVEFEMVEKDPTSLRVISRTLCAMDDPAAVAVTRRWGDAETMNPEPERIQ